MSARREKRLRQLERRVDALEFAFDRLEKRESRTEASVAEMSRIRTVLKVADAEWKPAPAAQSLWRRLMDAIKRRQP